METAKKFTEEEIRGALAAFDAEKYGVVLRAKGIVPAEDGRWIHFDYVPDESELRYGTASVTGRLCVIGVGLNEDGLKQQFGV